MVLCTEPFEVTAKNIARMMGLPEYPFVMVEHPIGSRSLPEIKVLAEQLLNRRLNSARLAKQRPSAP